ncbi:hypothetical protein EDD11_009479 [Mortierella claussenii]|nr:hypothetical protein EDD11_009479 [Mortierella claussenii]
MDSTRNPILRCIQRYWAILLPFIRVVAFSSFYSLLICNPQDDIVVYHSLANVSPLKSAASAKACTVEEDDEDENGGLDSGVDDGDEGNDEGYGDDSESCGNEHNEGDDETSVEDGHDKYAALLALLPQRNRGDGKRNLGLQI